jgi:hypothetical protein
MKGTLNKHEEGWLVRYGDMEFLPLHPDFIEMMDTCFTSKFTQVVDFEMVLCSHSKNKDDYYAKLIIHTVESNEMIEDDVEKLAETEYPIFDGDLLGIANNQQHSRVDFIKGYNKAKEKYKYTEDDLKLAMNYGYVQGDTGFQGVANLDDLLDLIHIKIKKSSRPTHFECETTPMNLDEIREQGKGFLNANIYKIKTTTNSQGQEELVGKYLNL